MVEAQFLLQLLMRLLADPPRLDGAGEDLDRGVGSQVREIVFALATRSMLADQPDLFAREKLVAHIENALGRTVGHAYAQGRDPCAEARTFAGMTAAAGVRTPILPQPLRHREINENLGLPGAYTQPIDAFIGAQMCDHR